MRWNNGDIDLDAEELDPDDYDAIDFTDFDLGMEESLKDLDLSFLVPDLSECDDAETAAAWLKSPRLMLGILAFRLNEILEICEARSFPATVIQLKPNYIYTDEEKRASRLTWKFVFLTGVSFVFHQCGHIVDIVNTIQPTPFKGEILSEFGKCVHCGDTPEFDRSVKCYKGALRELAVWIRTKEIHDGIEPDEPSAAPRTIGSILTQLLSHRTGIEQKNISPEVVASTTKASAKPPKETVIRPSLVSPEDVASKLESRNIRLAGKTLKNSRTREWGDPDGREGNAHLYDWDRIRPIVERQFNVEFDD